MLPKILRYSHINPNQKIDFQNKAAVLEEQFVRIFRGSPFLSAIITVEGRYVDVNDRWVEVLGYAREEVVGHHYREYNNMSINRESDLPLLLAKIPVSNLEITYITKSGEKRIGLFSRELIEVNGQQCFYGVVNDITELKQIESKVQELEKMDLIAQMAAGVAHEIRNPLTTISLYLQAFALMIDSAEYKSHFELLLEEVSRINQIIGEFLTLARNKAVVMKPLNLSQLLIKIQPLLQTEAASQGKNYKTDLGIVPDILGDENELRQLILNIFRNGLEAMNERLNLTIRTRHHENKVILEIEDQGNGIPIDNLNNLGKPFFTTKEKGTGLGLAVSYNIIHRHNGSYDIKTGPNGTVFSIFFDATGDAGVKA